MTWLADAPALSGLDRETQRRLTTLTPMEAPTSTPLFHPGDVAQGFVIVLSGSIDVFLTGPNGRDILLYSVTPGESCVQSTLGLLGGEDYSGEAITRCDSRLVLIPRAMFLELMDRSDSFRAFVFTAFAGRMQSMINLLEKLAFQRVEARLAQCLLDRAEGGTLKATHAEIATFIGSAREVVSRRLEALERRGLLHVDRGAVHIRDASTLSEIAAAQ